MTEHNPRNVLEQRGQLVSDIADFAIKPSDIDASVHLFDAFGNTQTETSAGWIIRMCQRNGSWAPFTKEDIESFYREHGPQDGFTFNQLIKPGMGFFIQEGRREVGGGWIVEKEGKYYVTTAFVEAAHKSSPATSTNS